jgi:hypothetical protein
MPEKLKELQIIGNQEGDATHHPIESLYHLGVIMSRLGQLLLLSRRRIL